MSFSTEVFRDYYTKSEVTHQYDRVRTRYPHLRAIRRRELDFYLTNVPQGEPQICEIGVGTGFVTEHLIARGNVYGIEPSRPMREMCLAKLGSPANLELVDGDILQLTLPRCYDLIVASRVLIHLTTDQIIQIISRAANFLKVGGQFCFDVSGPWTLRYYLSKLKLPISHTNISCRLLKVKKHIDRSPNIRLARQEAIEHLTLWPLAVAGKMGIAPARLERAFYLWDRRMRRVGLTAARRLLSVERT